MYKRTAKTPSAPIICRKCNQSGHYARGYATNTGPRVGGPWNYGGPDIQGTANTTNKELEDLGLMQDCMFQICKVNVIL